MDKYLHAGISALANTSTMLGYPWFFGHTGASVLAGYFLLRENELAAEVRNAISGHLDKIIASDAKLFDLVSVDNRQVCLDPLTDAIADCSKAHSTTGHGVIYGSLALKAIAHEPALLTERVSEGLVALSKNCLVDVPNRHFGINDYHALEVDYTGMRMFSSVQEAADYALTVHSTIYPDQTIDGSFYFLAGDLLHAVTYAHALLELDSLGFQEMASQGIEALARHIHLSSRKHEELKAIADKQAYDPETLSFWERPMTEPHHIKLAYSSMALTRGYSASKRQVIMNDLSKYWASYQ